MVLIQHFSIKTGNSNEIILRNRDSKETVQICNSDIVMSYATREWSHSGFSEFMKTLPILFREFPI